MSTIRAYLEETRAREGFVRKGARNFIHIATPALIREGWE